MKTFINVYYNYGRHHHQEMTFAANVLLYLQVITVHCYIQMTVLSRCLLAEH